MCRKFADTYFCKGIVFEKHEIPHIIELGVQVRSAFCRCKCSHLYGVQQVFVCLWLLHRFACWLVHLRFNRNPQIIQHTPRIHPTKRLLFGCCVVIAAICGILYKKALAQHRRRFYLPAPAKVVSAGTVEPGFYPAGLLPGCNHPCLNALRQLDGLCRIAVGLVVDFEAISSTCVVVALYRHIGCKSVCFFDFLCQRIILVFQAGNSHYNAMPLQLRFQSQRHLKIGICLLDVL